MYFVLQEEIKDIKDVFQKVDSPFDGRLLMLTETEIDIIMKDSTKQHVDTRLKREGSRKLCRHQETRFTEIYISKILNFVKCL